MSYTTYIPQKRDLINQHDLLKHYHNTYPLLVGIYTLHYILCPGPANANIMVVTHREPSNLNANTSSVFVEKDSANLKSMYQFEHVLIFDTYFV